MISVVEVLNWMWAALGLYWLWSARGTEKTVADEAPWWRVLRLVVLVATFMLLLSTATRIGPLAWRFVVESRIVRGIGVGLTGAGILLCVWARRNLGKYWSDKVVLKQEHQLIRSGSYAYLRHPIYSGVLLGIAGTALAVGEWRGVAAFGLMATNYFVKARREERMLAAQFGQEYEEYRRHAGFALPRW